MLCCILTLQDDSWGFGVLYQNNAVFRILQQHSQLSTGHELNKCRTMKHVNISISGQLTADGVSKHLQRKPVKYYGCTLAPWLVG